MNKHHSRIIFVVLCLSFACLPFSKSNWFVNAQEKPNETSSEKTTACQECCTACRDFFYSKCSLSPVMADSFGVLNQETEMARLDNFAQSVNNSPEADAYIVVYGGKINKYGEMEARTNRVRNYLIDFKKLDPSRIIFVTGGFREKFGFELWLSPVKNGYPPIVPSVLPEKVRFKGKMTPLSSY